MRTSFLSSLQTVVSSAGVCSEKLSFCTHTVLGRVLHRGSFFSFMRPSYPYTERGGGYHLDGPNGTMLISRGGRESAKLMNKGFMII